MSIVEDLLNWHRSQLGVIENPPNSNKVKYNTEYYGREVSGPDYPWCCVYQWCGFSAIGATKLFYNGKKTASCTTLYNFYKNRGKVVTPDEAQPGDLVFFTFTNSGRRNGIKEHIGICEVAPKNGSIVTIDGNTGATNEANGGAVLRRTRDLYYVTGVVRPDYASFDQEDETEDMRIYHWFDEIPDWARPSAEKAYQKGIIKPDATSGAVSIYESNLQTIVWLDRLGLLD